MKFENTKVFNFEGALRGLRNPKESWSNSDSFYEPNMVKVKNLKGDVIDECQDGHKFTIGPNDMKLAQILIKAGSEHRKFLRQIMVSVDITAPQFWWAEFDTYKVGTVANSTSKMHKITSRPITLDCFEISDYKGSMKTHLTEDEAWDGTGVNDFIIQLIEFLENLRRLYIETKDIRYWKELIRWLPESWLQTRTVTMNYENLLGMCSRGQRRHHKLTEWSEDFISWARTLEYAQEFLFIDELQ